MDDPLVVRVRDRIRDGEHGGDEGEPALQRGGGRDLALERLPGDQLHRVERRAILAASGVVDRDDRGVLEAGGDQRLADEPAARAFVGGEQLLERDLPLEHFIARLDHATDPTATDLGTDRVAIVGHLRKLARGPRRWSSRTRDRGIGAHGGAERGVLLHSSLLPANHATAISAAPTSTTPVPHADSVCPAMNIGS